MPRAVPQIENLCLSLLRKYLYPNPMKKIYFILLICFAFQTFAQNCKEIVGYYAGWQWYDRNKIFNPQSVDYDKYTIINYSFFRPNPDGSLSITDPWGDKNQLLGPINWATAPAGYDTQYDFGNPAYHQPNQKLSDYVHQAGRKLLVSLGGWTFSDNYPAIAADPMKRAKHCNDMNTIVKLYDLDGIDIDWEYPGYAPHNGTPADKANFTLLLQQMRDSLDAIEGLMGRDLLLTAAVGASADNQANVEWNTVKNLLDLINVMTYDYYGSFYTTTNHNSPLYPPAQGISGYSCQQSIDNLLALGVPADRLVMGVPFYGRTQMTVGAPGLFVQGTGQPDNTNFGISDGTPQYYEALEKLPLFDYHWDAQAMVPYLTGKSINSFVSYDDPTSVEKKAEFINLRNLRGAIVWEISGDMIETAPNSAVIAGTPLLDKLYTTMCTGSVGVVPTQAFAFELYPKPATTQLHILLKQTHNEPIRLGLYDLNGRLVKEVAWEHSDYFTLEVGDLQPGMYVLKMQSGRQFSTAKFWKV